jgi:hypothetical protein
MGGGFLASGEAAAAFGVGWCVVQLVVVVEGRLVLFGELVAVQLDVGRSLTCSLDTATCRLSGPIVIPGSGTKVKWRPTRPSLTVPNIGSLVSTST